MNIIHGIQAVISIILIGLVLIQQRGAEGLGSSFGGSFGGAAYSTRRGLERVIFIATIIFGIAFLVLAILSFRTF